MKLYQLVKLRNLLDESVQLADLKELADMLLQRIDIAINTDFITSGHKHSIEQVRTYYANVLNLLETPPKQLSMLRNDINAQIAELTNGFDKRGYMINGMEASGTATADDDRNTRVLAITSQTVDMIKGRIELYSDWKYPGLEIGPGDGKWTNLLVANDPLYVADTEKEYLANTAAQFTPEYKHRLRPYALNWDGVTLDSLPKNQIGFAFAWNVFNFFPKFELTTYLYQLFGILRPGGVLMFSYNNCDVPTMAKYAEEGWMSWMPKTLLLEIVKEIGYEVIAEFDPESSVSWIEVKKPGTLSTVKAHQVMGEILDKNN